MVSLLPTLLQQLGYESGPTGLVAGPDAGAVVTVKVFMEGYQVSPVRVRLKLLGPAENWTATIAVS